VSGVRDANAAAVPDSTSDTVAIAYGDALRVRKPHAGSGF